MASSSTGSSTGAARKRSPAKKAQKTAGDPPQKTAAKKEPTKKEPARKRPAARGSAPRAEARPAARPGRIASEVASELLELTGKSVEGVTRLERTDDGWVVEVEVVEVHRIPDTTDILSLYEVQADSHGALQSYRRLRRYARGVPGDD